MVRAAGLARLLALLVVVITVLISALAMAGALAGGSGSGLGRAGSRPAAGTVRIYFTSGEQLAPVVRRVPSSADPVTAALRWLLAGPTAGERRSALDSAIPSGTQLRSVTVDDGMATIVLDGRFTTGAGTTRALASAAYSVRLAQVTFTATAVPGIRRAQVSAAGMKTVLLSRADFFGPGSAAAPTPTLSGPESTAGLGPTPTPSSQPGPTSAAGPLASSASPSTQPAVGGSPSSAPAAGPAIKPKDARQVQAALVRLKYLPPNAVTGTFDYRTSQAVMAFQSWDGLRRDGVVGKQTARSLEAAQPPVAAKQGSGRWVEIHRAQSTLLLVQDGVVAQAVHCSTGMTMDAPPYDTPAGSYTVFAKMLESWSVPYKVWMPYAAYFNGGIAIHGLDYVPAYPASHGCVRVSMPEAPTVYAFVSVGTPVYVF
jgi:lipoprotein-anchoring transpeptidase ErfK/SrfK